VKNIVIIFCLSPVLLLAQAQEAKLLGRWDLASIPGSAAYNNRYNEIWSVAVKGREYAIIGSTMGTHFIDVTNPTLPAQSDFVPGKTQGPGVIHRDYKTYKNYVYAVCDEGESSLQVIDVSSLPDSVHVVYDSDEILNKAHNLSIDSTSALLYAWVFRGSPAYGGFSGMAVLSLADPENPTFVKAYNHVEGFHFNHIHDGYVRNDTVFLDAGYNGFGVADFSDPLNPKLLGTMSGYPFAGYNHSGWLSDDSRYFYLADETHGSPLKTVDVQNLEDIQVIDTYNAESTPTQIPHNPLVACNYLYVAYYYDGLQVYDISDPENAVRVLYYDTSTEPDGENYKGAWGVNPFLPSGNILIADMQNGLWVFEGVGDKCNSPAVPSQVKSPANEQVKVSPQPAVDNLRIALPENFSGNGALTLININGQTVLSQVIDNQNFEINFDDKLPSGLYFLNIKFDSKTITQKVIVQR
jgi:choice-of-anchor B domain-containing protein